MGRRFLTKSSLPVHVVVELVVAAECGQAAPADGQREEDLGRGVHPHPWLLQLLPLRGGVEVDAVAAARHCDAANQQHQHRHVGHQRHHVGHLSDIRKDFLKLLVA